MKLLHEGLDVRLGIRHFLIALVTLRFLWAIQNSLDWQIRLLEGDFQKATRVDVRLERRDAKPLHDARNLLRSDLLGNQGLRSAGYHLEVALAVLPWRPLHEPAVHGTDERSDHIVIENFDMIFQQDVTCTHEH